MSQFGVPQAEIIDSLISDLAFVAVSFQQSSADANHSAKQYVYKYITSQMYLQPGDRVIVERRSASDAADAMLDTYTELMAEPQYFGDKVMKSTAQQRARAQVVAGNTTQVLDVPPLARFNRNVAIVLAVGIEPDYPPTAETFNTRIAWVVSKIETAQHDANFRAEKELWDAIKKRVVASRREQIIRAMLGDIALESPLIKPKALT